MKKRTSKTCHSKNKDSKENLTSVCDCRDFTMLLRHLLPQSTLRSITYWGRYHVRQSDQSQTRRSLKKLSDGFFPTKSAPSSGYWISSWNSLQFGFLKYCWRLISLHFLEHSTPTTCFTKSCISLSQRSAFRISRPPTTTIPNKLALGFGAKPTRTQKPPHFFCFPCTIKLML